MNLYGMKRKITPWLANRLKKEIITMPLIHRFMIE